MKAIYINLDPYLAAFAAWLKGGKSGPAPTGPSVPLAVTVPLGEDVGIYCPGNNGDHAEFVVGDVTMAVVGGGDWDPGDYRIPNIAEGLALGFSAYPGTEDFPQVYAVKPVTADSIVFAVKYGDTDTGADWTLSFPVLVSRETASGPVDLVDFTPPAAAIAAGTDLKGCKFDGNEIVAAKTTGALSAPAGA